jgi:2'-5' RNA ligase
MDQDEAFRRIWQQFRAFNRLADGRHDTPAWRAHKGFFAVCGIRVPTGILQPALGSLRSALAGYPFIRVHPDRFLHITLQEIGFVCDEPKRADELSPERLDEFVTAAATPVSETKPFDITLGGANSFQDAAFLDVHDRGRCARLHSRLRELAAVASTDRYAYLPHSTIAHYTEETSPGNLPATLARWRDTRFGTFRVNAVELMTLDLDVAYPPLEPYAVIPLGG